MIRCLSLKKQMGEWPVTEQWILILKNKEARHGTDPS